MKPGNTGISIWMTTEDIDMKRIALTLALATFAVSAFAADYVRPHVRKDGTFVQGHYRSSPDSSRYNNYSTKGNYNPYTGQRGTVSPHKSYEYRQPSYNYQYRQPSHNYDYRQSDYYR